MPLISDNELKRRLEAYDYPVPPITESTKKVLLKKLCQLDKEASSGKRRPPSNLVDYSSAEEEASSTPSLRRRKVSNSAYKTEPARAKILPPPGRKSTNGGHQQNSKLVQISDGEDDDDDASNQSSSEEDEDDDAEEDEEDAGSEDVGLQTSLNSDGGTPHTNGTPLNGARRTQRFASSTPNTPVRSTASYLNGSKPSPSPLPFPPNSPLRRAVAKSREFGSLGTCHIIFATRYLVQCFILGEALASLSSTASNSSNTAESVVTQAPKTTSETTTTDSSGRNVANKVAKRPTVNSFSVSVFIIALAVLFFGIIALKYVSLRPRMDIENRLVVCHGQATDDCISPEFAKKCVALFNIIVPLVEEQSANVKCSRNETSGGQGMSVANILQVLEESPEWRNEPLREILSHLVQVVINTKPQLDIVVINSGDEMVLHHDNPQLDWVCWFNIKSRIAANLIYISLMIIGSLGIVGLLLFAGYKFYKWRSDMILREKQDVFELVEQVLSLLVKHHHHLTMQDGSGTPRSVANGSRASLPVSHIRDQLIPPADRKRKRRIWNKVVQYIHESESRVRVDVQVIYGEEHKVWQWIPEINWNPISHPGPNPYVAPIHVMPSAAGTPSSQPPSSRIATPTSSRWQGSAFSSLNRNVAVPTYAPSSCLKVRHMFDKSLMTQNSGWVKQVSEEILQRCAGGGAICHIAVDTESTEGCVYIKAVTNDDAANVFKTLHGQWYRGNLVTAKYLRDERYFEKFPDAKNHTLPMRPNYYDALN